MILRGWKSICAAAGGMSEHAARMLMREHGLPVAMVQGTPMSTTGALEAWVRCKCQERKPGLVLERPGRQGPGEGLSVSTCPLPGGRKAVI